MPKPGYAVVTVDQNTKDKIQRLLLKFNKDKKEGEKPLSEPRLLRLIVLAFWEDFGP